MNFLRKAFFMTRTSFALAGLFCLLAASCRKPTFDQKILAEVAAYNQRERPFLLADGCTRRDSLHFDTDTRTYSYCHTITGEADGNPVVAAYLGKQNRDRLLHELQGSIQMIPLKEQGIRIRYVYYSESTKEILADFTFTPADYNP